jgi:plastocyanin
MKIALSIVIAVIIIAGGVLVVSHHKQDTKGSSGPNSQNMNNMDMSGQPGSNTSQPSSTNTVEISDFSFSPADITIKKGTTVTWTNKDSVTHTVTESDGQTGPNSKDLDENASYTFTYNSAGTFKYKCNIHPDMTGTVTVTE